MFNYYLKNMSLFTIITITYNNKEELIQTIFTTLNQSLCDFELIIIDGASTDGSVDYLSKLNDQRIQYLSEADNGIYDAMNKGLSLAKNEYVIFMNSGDYFSSENILMEIANEIVTHKIKPMFIYGNAYEVDEYKAKHYKRARNVNLKITGMFTHHQAMIYANKIINHSMIRFNTDLKIASDYDFTLNFLNKINPNECLKLNIPICIFSLDGISSKENYLGFKEQLQIKLKYFSIISVIFVSIFQCLIILIRKHTPIIYRLYRYHKL